MQLWLPNRKTLSALYQARNVEMPDGDPAHLVFQWALAPMDVQELTRIVDVDKYIWGMSGSFFHTVADGGDQGAGVKVQITHVHGDVQRTLYNKPLAMQNVMSARPANNNRTYGPMLMRPTYPLHQGDSLLVQVFSQDRTKVQQVEIVMFCSQTSTAGN